MLRFTRIYQHPLTAQERAAAVVLRLSYAERAKRRAAQMLDVGTPVAVVLPRDAAIRDASVLADDGGRFAIVVAAAEPLARVTAATPLALLRAVYHLANRHVPAQLSVDAVLIERDPVLEKMLRALGAVVEHLEAPFEPEAGAYDTQQHAGAAHGHRQAHHGDVDEVSATLGEQLSIEAHRRRAEKSG